jgi:uncharacterized phiE125 gp8 family phage protein
MALAITSAPEGELLTVEDAKRSLRLFDNSLDDEISALIVAARDYCERYTNRTLRTTVTRTLKQSCWWRDEYCRSDWRLNSQPAGLRLPWPPLLAVSTVTYYDADNASQTLSSSNYSVELSTDGGGRISWASTATIPTLYSRPDAVTITFTTGYASLTTLPPVALQAMKLAVEMYFTKDTSLAEVNERSIKSLLGLVDWTGYA